MTEENDYLKYFNKGNDCDSCFHKKWIREDMWHCEKEYSGEECLFVEVE